MQKAKTNFDYLVEAINSGRQTEAAELAEALNNEKTAAEQKLLKVKEEVKDLEEKNDYLQTIVNDTEDAAAKTGTITGLEEIEYSTPNLLDRSLMQEVDTFIQKVGGANRALTFLQAINAKK